MQCRSGYGRCAMDGVHSHGPNLTRPMTTAQWNNVAACARMALD